MTTFKDNSYHFTQKNSLFLIPLTVLIFASLGLLLKDTLYVGGIPPWDASFYINLAKNFYASLKGLTDLHVGPYQIQRILPSGVIYVIFKLFHIAPTDTNVIRGFSILNVLSITGIAYFWCLVASKLDISNKGKWLGAIFLFINFAVLKHRTYDIVLTDSSAFFFGMLSFYFYISRNQFGLIITAILSAFVWPTTLYVCIILLAFPRQVKSSPAFPEQKPSYFKAVAWGGPLFIVACSSCIILYLYHIHFKVFFPIFSPTFYLSLFLALLYLFFALHILIHSVNLSSINQFLTPYLTWRYLVKLILLLGLALIVKGIQHHFSSPTGFHYPIYRFVMVTFQTSVIYPLAFFISHVMYLGPSIIFALFWWKKITKYFFQWGLGIGVAMTMAIILALNSESRMLLNFYPILVAAVVKVADKKKWSPSQYIFLALLALLTSKVWLTIGPMKIVTGRPTEEVILDNQLLFMNNGPFMSTSSYLIQACSAILLSCIIYIFYIWHRKSVRGN